SQRAARAPRHGGGHRARGALPRERRVRVHERRGCPLRRRPGGTAMKSGRFTDRVAIVTGGASGLGEAIARRLAAGGARVVGADIDASGAERVARAIGAEGGHARAVATDVTRATDVSRLVEAATALGGLHVLVLSAAVEVRANIEDTDDADWQRVLDVNLKGPFLCMNHALPVMARSGGGAVVALGSTLGGLGQAGLPASCASQGALGNLCNRAAIEHAPDQTRE